MNNRRKDLFALGAGALGVISLLAYLIWSGYEQAIQAAEITTRNYAAIIEARLDATLRRADAGLQELADEIPVAALSRQAEPRYAAKVKLDLRGHMINFPELAGIRITDANGERLYTSDSGDPPRTQLADRDYFRQVRDNPGTALVFSEVLISRVGRRPSVIVARALRDVQGAFRGTLFAVIELEYFQKLFQTLDIGAGGSVSVYRSDTFSEVVRWPPIGDKLNTQLPPDSQTRKLFVHGEKTATVENFSRRDRILRIYSYQMLERFPFFVAVGIAHEHILADWRARSLVVGLSALLLLGLLAALLFRLWQAEGRQEQAMAALMRSEGRFRALFDRANDGIMVVAPSGQLIAVNESFARMHGYTTQAMQSMSLKNLDTPETARLIPERMQRLVSGEPMTFEVEHYHKDGHVLPLEVSASLISSDREPLIQAFHRDISERKQAETAIKELNRQKELLLNSVGEGLFGLDSEGTTTFVNPVAEKLLGWRAEELLGKSTHGIFHHTKPDGSPYPAETCPIYKAFRDGNVHYVDDDVFWRKDGTSFAVEYTSTPILGEDRSLIGAVVVFKDITERKRLEEVHLQAQKLESLGTLAGGIAHDFNNILAAIRGNADLAAADAGPNGPVAESIDEIRKASTRASELVRRITTFARPKETKRDEVDLRTVVAEVLKLLRATLPAAITLRTEFGKRMPAVLADTGQIHEAIVNLTTNAAHAIGPHPGLILFRLEDLEIGREQSQRIAELNEGCYVCLTVTDSGCGMDAAIMERVFDVFYTTKPPGEGTGLGLSMVHGIMKGHGGAVTVESAPGKGSSFRLYFPASGNLAQPPVTQAAAEAVLVPKLCVLYVDDEPALISLARRTFARLGHSISAFTDPQQALAAFRAAPQEFDIVVTDLSMPHMSGFELAREMQKLRPGIPVIMTTGYIHEEDEGHAREAGVREMILKPFTVDELGCLLEEMFRCGELNGKSLA